MASTRTGREKGTGSRASGRDIEALSDDVLVARCRAGDGRAWEAIVRRYRRLVYAIPVRFGLAPEEADDVFQNTFVRLVERLDTLREPRLLRAWLVTTARRLSLDAITRRKAIPESEAVLATVRDPDPIADEEVSRLEEQHLVRRAFEQLSERCRTLLDLLYYAADEPSYEAIGARLQMPLGSIGPTRARCLEKLLRLYEAIAAGEEG